MKILLYGYTEDSKKKSRYVNYRLHNPLFELLYEIPEGDEKDKREFKSLITVINKI